MYRELRRRQPVAELTRERNAIAQEIRDALERRVRRLREEVALLELAYKALMSLPGRDRWHIVRDGKCDVCSDPVNQKPYAVTCPVGHRLHVPHCLSFDVDRSMPAERTRVVTACSAEKRTHAMTLVSSDLGAPRVRLPRLPYMPVRRPGHQ